MNSAIELKSPQETSLFPTRLDEWRHGPQVLDYGAILICRQGEAVLRVNYKDWEMFENAVITVFPNDVVEIVSEERRGKREESTCRSEERRGKSEESTCRSEEERGKSDESTCRSEERRGKDDESTCRSEEERGMDEESTCRSEEERGKDVDGEQSSSLSVNGQENSSLSTLRSSLFEVEMLRYSPSLLREASLQLEHTVYSSLREDRCRQDSPVVTHIVDGMFALLKVYFDQADCTCLSQLVHCQLKAFFIGFHEYMQRNPDYRPDEVKSYRVRKLFNLFMRLMERDYKLSRDVNYYASQMNITPKYLTNIVRQVTDHTPKAIIDQYVILQIKTQLQRTSQSVKEIAWEYHFADASFFCRYYKKHTGLTPQQERKWS